MHYEYHEDGTKPQNGEVFVFGSNLAGRHGAGAAKAAFHFYGAVYGVGVGHVGESYAIPSVNHYVSASLSLDEIAVYVKHFIDYTHYLASSGCSPVANNIKFFVTRIGCVLAGYKDSDIAPMFKGAVNCNFPEQWKEHLE